MNCLSDVLFVATHIIVNRGVTRSSNPLKVLRHHCIALNPKLTLSTMPLPPAYPCGILSRCRHALHALPDIKRSIMGYICSIRLSIVWIVDMTPALTCEYRGGTVRITCSVYTNNVDSTPGAWFVGERIVGAVSSTYKTCSWPTIPSYLLSSPGLLRVLTT